MIVSGCYSSSRGWGVGQGDGVESLCPLFRFEAVKVVHALISAWFRANSSRANILQMLGEHTDLRT